MRSKDEHMWIMGMYVQSAVATAVEHNLAGRKARSKYVKEPFTRSAGMDGKKLSEDELQKQRELFVAKLLTMKTNWEISQEEI